MSQRISETLVFMPTDTGLELSIAGCQVLKAGQMERRPQDPSRKGNLDGLIYLKESRPDGLSSLRAKLNACPSELTTIQKNIRPFDETPNLIVSKQ